MCIRDRFYLTLVTCSIVFVSKSIVFYFSCCLTCKKQTKQLIVCSVQYTRTKACIGSRLRRLKKDMKGVKLKDVKVLTGKGRLTDEEID